jgi:hypothetical protein
MVGPSPFRRPSHGLRRDCQSASDVGLQAARGKNTVNEAVTPHVTYFEVKLTD